MRRIPVFLFLLLIILFPSIAFSVARPNSELGIYFVYGLTGDVQGTLDSLHITGDGNDNHYDGVPNKYDLANGDVAIYGIISGSEGTYSLYVFDADGTDATDSPKVIRPNDFSAAGVWRLMSPRVIQTSSEKVSGTAGDLGLYEANSTDTSTAGERGPDSLTYSYRRKLPDTRPSSDNVVRVCTNSGESGDGGDSTPFVQDCSWADLDDYQLKAGDSAPSSDDTYNGFRVISGTAGENLAQWDLLYAKNSAGNLRWYRYDADGTDKTYAPRAIALAAITSGVSGNIGIGEGIVRNDGWSMTTNQDEGQDVYADKTTAGGITLTIPSTSGDEVAKVGYVLEENVVMFSLGNVTLVEVP